MKVCAKCGAEKDDSEFRVRQGGRVENTCRACEIAANKAWKKANKERYAASKKAWKQANPLSVKASAKAFRDANKVKVKEEIAAWRKANKAKAAAAEKAWRIRNSGRHNATNRRREATKLQATPSWFDEFDEFVIAEAHDLAARRAKATGVEWHVDHQVPLRSKLVQGFHCAANTAVITAKENLAKGNRHWPDQ